MGGTDEVPRGKARRMVPFICPLLTWPKANLEEHITHPQDRALAGFRGGAVVENLPANAGDAGSSPGLGRSHMPRSN